MQKLFIFSLLLFSTELNFSSSKKNKREKKWVNQSAATNELKKTGQKIINFYTILINAGFDNNQIEQFFDKTNSMDRWHKISEQFDPEVYQGVIKKLTHKNR